MFCFDEFSKTLLFTSREYNLKLFTLLDLLRDRSAFLNNDKRCWSAERIKLRHTTQAVALSTRFVSGFIKFCFDEFSKALLFGSKAYNLKLFTLLDLVWNRSAFLNNDKQANLQNELSWRTYHSGGRPHQDFVRGFVMFCFDEFQNPCSLNPKHTI